MQKIKLKVNYIDIYFFYFRGGDGMHQKKIVSSGFVIPVFLTGILILVGETHTQCQPYSPNFGNGRCWFGGKF